MLFSVRASRCLLRLLSTASGGLLPARNQVVLSIVCGHVGATIADVR